MNHSNLAAPLLQCDAVLFTQAGASNSNSDTAWTTLALACCMNGAVAVGLIAVFEISRGKRSVYARRLRELPHRTPTLPGRWPLQWLHPVATIGDTELRRMVGLDAMVCLQYLRFCLRVCAFCSFWSVLLLMPLYSAGKNPSVVDSFRAVTMEHVEDGSDHLWVSCALFIVYALFIIYALRQEWEKFIEWRVDFLVKGDPDAQGGTQLAYSVHVKGLPRSLRDSSKLFEYFDTLFPGEVHSAVVHIEVGPLRRVLDRRSACLETLEDALAMHPRSGHAADVLVERCRLDLNALNSDVKTIQDRILLRSKDTSAAVAERTIRSRLSPKRRDAYRDEEALLAENNNINQEVSATEDEEGQGAFDFRYGNVAAQLAVSGGEHFAGNISAIADGAAIGLNAVEKGLRLVTVGKDGSNSGFVTFLSKRAAVDATQVLLSDRAIGLEASPALDPRALIWENAAATRSEGWTRRAISTSALVTFGLLWFIPFLSALQGVGNIDELSQMNGLHFMAKLKHACDLNSDGGDMSETSFNAKLMCLESTFVTEQLPALLQVGFVAALPLILETISRAYERAKSESDVQRSVLGRYQGFQLIQVCRGFRVLLFSFNFICKSREGLWRVSLIAQVYATLVSNSLLSVATGLLAKPACAFDLLGTSIPATSAYFVQVITRSPQISGAFLASP